MDAGKSSLLSPGAVVHIRSRKLAALRSTPPPCRSTIHRDGPNLVSCHRISLKMAGSKVFQVCLSSVGGGRAKARPSFSTSALLVDCRARPAPSSRLEFEKDGSRIFERTCLPGHAFSRPFYGFFVGRIRGWRVLVRGALRFTVPAGSAIVPLMMDSPEDTLVLPLRACILSDDSELARQAEQRCRRLESYLATISFERIEHLPVASLEAAPNPAGEVDLVFFCLRKRGPGRHERAPAGARLRRYRRGRSESPRAGHHDDPRRRSPRRRHDLG